MTRCNIGETVAGRWRNCCAINDKLTDLIPHIGYYGESLTVTMNDRHTSGWGDTAIGSGRCGNYIGVGVERGRDRMIRRYVKKSVGA